MKTFVLMVLAAATCFAAEQKKKDAYDIRPDAAKPADAPASEKWQQDNKDKLAEATKPEALAAFVKDGASADALLAKVKTDYGTEPLDAFVVAAVTQYVMAPGACADARKIWTNALLKRAEGAAEDFVTQFCFDQLRWCACPSQAAKIEAIAARRGSKALKDFAAMIARELAAAK